eukprot:scaffold618_cov130-Cylindrotheca_fusiformis.AAC.34
MTSHVVSPTAVMPYVLPLPVIYPQPPSPETLSKMMMKTPCFAVQCCAQFHGPAIFWRWEDVCHYVSPIINQLRPAKFQRCNNIFQAIEYMMGNEEYSKLLKQALTANNTNNNEKKRAPTMSTTAGAAAQKTVHGPVGKEMERRQAFKANINKLREYKATHGSYHVVESPDNPSILAFYNRMRRQAFKYKNDPSTCTLNEEEIETLKSIGFLDELDQKTPGKRTLADMTIRLRKQWDAQFERVKQFTIQHNRLPKDNDGQHLYGWVSLQRRKMRDDMQKDENGSSNSKLTNEQILKLASIGISFAPAKRTVSNDERADQWIQYRLEHGKNPLARSLLGQFQQRVIGAYRRFKLGEISRMNVSPEVMVKLQDSGFPFPTDDDIRAFAEKQEQDKDKRRFSWDESYQKLFEFKKRHGHLVIPRSEPHLGGWAHHVRHDYSRLKRGLKSSLTQEKLAKLSPAALQGRENKMTMKKVIVMTTNHRIPNQGLCHRHHYQQQNHYQPDSVSTGMNDDAVLACTLFSAFEPWKRCLGYFANGTISKSEKGCIYSRYALSCHRSHGRLGVNFFKDAQEFAEFTKVIVDSAPGYKVVVNLIPFNDIGHGDYQKATDEDVTAFQKHMESQELKLASEKALIGYVAASAAAQQVMDESSKQVLISFAYRCRVPTAV